MFDNIEQEIIDGQKELVRVFNNTIGDLQNYEMINGTFFKAEVWDSIRNVAESIVKITNLLGLPYSILDRSSGLISIGLSYNTPNNFSNIVDI